METHFLLTGIPGAIGEHFLAVLIRKNATAFFTVLTGREKGDETKEVVDRLCATSNFPRNQISVVRGDITDPNLGLDATKYESLRTSVTHLIHGEYVDLLGDKEYGASINVYGTENLIYMAKHSKYLKHFVYISSIFVSGNSPGVFGEDDFDREQGFHNWFEKTRYVGEESVRSEMKNIPTTILRIGNLVGDSRTGAIAKFTPFYGLIKYCQRLQALPGMPPVLGNDNPLQLTPIDQLTAVLMQVIAQKTVSISQVFHVFDEQSIPSRQLFQEVCSQVADKYPSRSGHKLLWHIVLTPRITQDFFGLNKQFLTYLYGDGKYSAKNAVSLFGETILALPPPPDYLAKLCQFYRSQQGSK